ncbi:hypothetical protein GCM10027019_26500 [Melaminivora jejuensis]|uniref:hypothetical protein n=1 Tax=Melaminivora jejuensis TaxID=1267217 RepID=UPI001ADF02F7|nr:hypothetical protein [Melaminivora jejuensis]UHJ66359.1 hypothetical protein LVC68_07590 [Melaminivora jejuensis]
MPNLPDVAIGAVVAALIAGLISLLGLIVSKEQKTSEFRQAWIDALRSEIAAVIAHTNAIYGAGAANIESSVELWKVVRDDFVGINEATAKIRLRLNPKEAQAIAVLSTIESLENLLQPGQKMDYREINAIEKRLVGEAQLLLKEEWRRVQTGESTYRVARFTALAVSSACILALIALSLLRFTAA